MVWKGKRRNRILPDGDGRDDGDLDRDESNPGRENWLQMEKLAEQILVFKNAAERSGYDLNRFLAILDQD